MTHRVLVTGFGPFGPHTVNPTEQLVRSLGRDEVSGAEIHTAVLPVDYDPGLTEAVRLIDEMHPAAVIMCGLYAGRPVVTVEAIAVNVRDTPAHLAAAHGDGETRRLAGGGQPTASSPPFLWVTSSTRSPRRASRRQSYTAGTYVCNSTMYGGLNHVRRTGVDAAVGFIHFPASPEMALGRPSVPSMPTDLMRQALVIAIETVVKALKPVDDGQQHTHG